MKTKYVTLKYDEYIKWYKKVSLFSRDMVYRVGKRLEYGGVSYTYLQECDPKTRRANSFVSYVPDRFIIHDHDSD